MLEEKDILRLKEIFISRQECQTNLDSIDKRLGQYLVKTSVIETKLNMIVWLVTAVAGGIITVLIKLFFGS